MNINITLKRNQAGVAHPLALLIIVLVVLLVGFSGYKVIHANSVKAKLEAEQAQLQKGYLPQDLKAVLTVEKIKELMTQSSNARVLGIELQNQQATLIYQVKMSDGSVVGLHAVTGQSVELTDKNAREARALPANFSVGTTFERAREIAQAEFPEGFITSIALDMEVGKLVLDVRFADEARVYIDAANGKVVRVIQPRLDAAPQVNESTTDTSPGGMSSGSTPRSGSSGTGSSPSGDGSIGGSSNSDSNDTSQPMEENFASPDPSGDAEGNIDEGGQDYLGE